MWSVSKICAPPTAIQIHLKRWERFQQFGVRGYFLYQWKANIVCSGRINQVSSRTVVTSDLRRICLDWNEALLDWRLFRTSSFDNSWRRETACCQSFSIKCQSDKNRNKIGSNWSTKLTLICGTIPYTDSGSIQHNQVWNGRSFWRSSFNGCKAGEMFYWARWSDTHSPCLWS